VNSWTTSRSFAAEIRVGKYVIRQRLEKLDGAGFWTISSKLEDDGGEVMAERIEGMQGDVSHAKKIAQRQAEELAEFANEYP